MSDRRVTIVTGASRGIGAATVRELLRDGHRVVATGRDAGRLHELAATLPDDADLRLVTGHAGDPGAVDRTIGTAVTEFGRIDTVVANAGYATHDAFLDGDPEQWHDMVVTNVLGPALLARAAIPHLRRTRGRIVIVGSVAGHVHTRGNLYGVTKFAMTGLAENLRLLVSQDGIGVTLISPGAVRTGFFEPIGGPPDGRPGGYLDPATVAEWIAWVAGRGPASTSTTC
ncbi:SDR family oxidoreductase [Pseudonocardia sp. CA-107938]|uniref:SDR family oxidoreductase n=1 Tax=Pseudonocardia sp. CA-107938 TaxID=3240021 RepID=UPI003D8CFA48